MAGSNIFIIYPDSTGNNVTLSPRLGKGNYEPYYDTDAKVTLLDGSGVANGVMTANVRCESGHSSRLHSTSLMLGQAPTVIPGMAGKWT